MREKLRLLERTFDLDLLNLTQENAAFHITASPVARIERNSVAAQAFAAIMRKPMVSPMPFMCGPVYRDALAIYDAQHNLLNVLNICFDCDRLVTATGKEIQADAATYEALCDFLTRLGHPIGTL
ncbi:hypothetical protein QMK33_05435 [Hymenobacter sp. H14-R3]|uniref:hypothetical protein n=1 Tax=Hymenobacter sp. H14-R3 TaxID=3046308 RepID=UPI0024BB9E28|nr:hypothetical protein [Hymenobacter sp. H14-R3]MDJ0364586.1 hypothetical protein [Hymenobacter sp. H14-R3]